MKTKFTLLVLFIWSFFSASAQQPAIPNGGFETWTTTSPSYPDGGWDTGDHLIFELSSGIPQRGWCIKDTTPNNVAAGVASCRLRTDTVPLVNQIVPGIVAYSRLALDVNNNPYYIPLPFNGRPTVFSGNIKFAPNGADTGEYRVYLTKWDAVGDSEISIVKFDKPIVGIGNGFVAFSDTFQYLSSETPDSIIVAFSSGLISGNPIPGSILWVDNLAFEYLSTGIHHLDMDDAIQVFPNPVSGILNISIDNYMTGDIFRVYDLSGRLSKSVVLDKANYTLNISELSEGAYIYAVENTAGKIIHQSKFNILK